MKKIISILALPRSGTTLLAAVLDAHPNIASWYEIYSSNCMNILPDYKKITDLTEDYHALFSQNISQIDYLIIKETNTFPRDNQKISGIEYVDNTLKQIRNNSGIDINNILLMRDIRHIYLSRLEGLRKWWGKPNAKPNKETYIVWVNEAFDGLNKLLKISENYETYCVSYESLMSNFNENIKQILDYLKIPFDNSILNYHESINLTKVMGDMNLMKSPKPPNIESIEKRHKEWEQVSKNIYPIPAHIKKKEEILLSINSKVREHTFLKYNTNSFRYVL